jgi:hypothetical protein
MQFVFNKNKIELQIPETITLSLDIWVWNIPETAGYNER